MIPGEDPRGVGGADGERGHRHVLDSPRARPPRRYRGRVQVLERRPAVERAVDELHGHPEDHIGVGQVLAQGARDAVAGVLVREAREGLPSRIPGGRRALLIPGGARVPRLPHPGLGRDGARGSALHVDDAHHLRLVSRHHEGAGVGGLLHPGVAAVDALVDRAGPAHPGRALVHGRVERARRARIHRHVPDIPEALADPAPGHAAIGAAEQEWRSRRQEQIGSREQVDGLGVARVDEQLEDADPGREIEADLAPGGAPVVAPVHGSGAGAEVRMVGGVEDVRVAWGRSDGADIAGCEHLLKRVPAVQAAVDPEFRAQVDQVGIDRIEGDGADVGLVQPAGGADYVPGQAPILASIGAAEVAAADDGAGGARTDPGERAAGARIDVRPGLTPGPGGREQREQREEQGVAARQERPVHCLVLPGAFKPTVGRDARSSPLGCSARTSKSCEDPRTTYSSRHASDPFTAAPASAGVRTVRHAPSRVPGRPRWPP